MLWLLSRGHTAVAVSQITGYSAYWIGQIANRYNTHGPDRMVNRRHTTSHRPAPRLSASLQEDLRQAFAEAARRHVYWTGHEVARWMAERLGRPISYHLGWDYLQRLGARWRMPRPRHVQADPAAQTDFVARLRPLLRAVATAFPQASVELWAVEIVCTQMTKSDMLTGGRRGNTIADLDVVVSDHHTVNEQFDELALLLKAGCC
jgi:transposase